MISLSKVDNVKKIAVLRAGALGDFMVILPALQALRDTYPHAEIVLLGRSWQKEFLTKGRSVVDRVEVVPVKKGVGNEYGQHEDIDALQAFFARMRAESFDIAISFQGNGISANSFLNELGASVTAGSWCEGAAKLDRSIRYYYYQHEVMRYLEIARLVGATTDIAEPSINILPGDWEDLQRFDLCYDDNNYILINPVANDIRRMWPLENYSTLADLLTRRKARIIFVGSMTDRAMADDVIGAMQYKAINACGISIGGLAALASRASVMIAPDTGPLHVAQAVKCPTIGLYWAPNVINWAPLNRAIHRPVISWQLTCPHCGIIPNDPYPFEPQTGCRHEVSFVSDIQATAILQAVDDLLSLSVKHDHRRAMVPNELLYT
jgi:ADP-heptose:LPS heptosyltransferase